MILKIPEQFRAEFNKSADFAVERGEFTPSQLAEYLGRGLVAASMMVRYMENAELVTKGKGDDMRHARITLEEWDAIERSIENYQPTPLPEPEVIPEAVEEVAVVPAVTVDDIIPHRLEFIGKTLWAEQGTVTISDGSQQTVITLEEIRTVYIHKGWLFGKSSMTFSRDGELPVKAKLREDTVMFKRRDFDRFKQLADSVATRLEIEVKRY